VSFSDLLEQPPTTGRGITFLAEGERVTWEQLYEDSLRAAGGLQAREARVVGLLGGSSRKLVTALLGCIVAGVVPVVLPAPNRRRPEAEAAAANRLGLTHIVYDAPLEELAHGYGNAVAAADLPAAPGERAHRAPDDVVLLQLTSGTTEHARAIPVTDACLTAYVAALAAAVDRDPEVDLQLSWLPLHYDLGLISALLFSAGTGTEFALATPELFISSPSSWMRWMSDLGATETLAPSFAFGIAASMAQPGLDLSRCRMTNNGGEMVAPESARRFVAAMEPLGLDPGVMSCGYGLAEATSAVTVRKPGGGLLVDTVDREVLEHESRAVTATGARSRELASQGPPLPGVSIRIVDALTGDPRQERHVGEIEIAGPTVCPGELRNGWLRTGDLGYIAGGELYPCGRLKDLIIAGGRNIAPEQIEHAAGALAGVRTGNVIAFAIHGAAREEIVVVAECRAGPDGLRDAIAREVRAEIGLSPYEVVLIAPGTLPKTASGKLQRAACRARYLSGELAGM
jgi:fatty-acyl-CoA synthase